MGYKNWRSPVGEGHIFTELDDELHFTMDAAASEANALCDRYCTENGKFEKTPIPESPLWYPEKLSDKDGLDLDNWKDERVWCNPPYDDSIVLWVETGRWAVERRLAPLTAVCLPPSIDTKWFSWLWPDGEEDAKIGSNDFFNWIKWVDRGVEYSTLLYRGRERFWRPKNTIVIPTTYANDPDGTRYEPDENDIESVPGDHPRAGNLVVVTRLLYA